MQQQSPSPAEHNPGPRGLQAERTGLAWSRTALAATANAALLAVREVHTAPSPLAAIPIGLALVIAAATILIGRRRDAALRTDPLPRPLAPRGAVSTLGAATALLALLSGGLLLL